MLLETLKTEIVYIKSRLHESGYTKKPQTITMSAFFFRTKLTFYPLKQHMAKWNFKDNGIKGACLGSGVNLLDSLLFSGFNFQSSICRRVYYQYSRRR